MQPRTGTFWEDDAPTCLEYVRGNNGAAIVQADITAITCKVFDLDSATPETAISSPKIIVANVIFDTLQTDARWTIDGTGYNFRHTPAASIFTNGDRRYRIEYYFDPAVGEDFKLVFEPTALKIYGS